MSSIGENGHLLDPLSQVDVLTHDLGAILLFSFCETRKFNLAQEWGTDK